MLFCKGIYLFPTSPIEVRPSVVALTLAKPMRIFRIFVSFAFIFALGCRDSNVVTAPNELQPYILSETLDEVEVPPRTEEPSHSFVHMSDAELWEYISEVDGMALMGFRSPAVARGSYDGRVLITPKDLSVGKQAVLGQVGVIPIRESAVLPIIQVQIADYSTFVFIRGLPFVDFIEPIGIRRSPNRDTSPFGAAFSIDQSSSSSADSWSGCYPPATWQGDAADQRIGNELISWSHTNRYNKITDAWIRSQGDNIRVAVLDTGLDPAQDQFADWRFHNEGRVIIRTHAESGVSGDPKWRDECGHGTRIAGIIAAPKDGSNIAGIAYKSDLISIRADDDVIMSNSGDVVWAIDIAAFSGAHIVQMAFKTDKWFSGVSDVIRHYYHRSPAGVLFVAAAGTTPGAKYYNYNTVFPAEMDEVIAVSAIEKTGERASDSHGGPAIEFGGYVSQPTTGVPSLFGNAGIVRLSGTSAASATVSGIAALIWARYPHWTNKQVRERMRFSATHPYSRNWGEGYGTLNAYVAVGGFSALRIDGPTCVGRRATQVMVTAMPSGDGAFQYRWSNGATTQSTTYPAPPPGQASQAAVYVTDVVELKTMSAYLTFEKIADDDFRITC